MKQTEGNTKPTSPIFIAEFADGERTRMTVFTRVDRLDVARGARLARHAYRSRTGKEPTPVTEAPFESGGAVLATYTAEQLAKVTP